MGRFLESGTPTSISKYMFLKYLLISKKTSTTAQAIQELVFGGLLEEVLSGWYPQTMSKCLYLKYLLI